MKLLYVILYKFSDEFYSELWNGKPDENNRWKVWIDTNNRHITFYLKSAANDYIKKNAKDSEKYDFKLGKMYYLITDGETYSD